MKSESKGVGENEKSNKQKKNRFISMREQNCREITKKLPIVVFCIYLIGKNVSGNKHIL